MKKLLLLLIILLFTLLICISCSGDKDKSIEITTESSPLPAPTENKPPAPYITLPGPQKFSSTDELGVFIDQFDQYPKSVHPIEIPWPHYIPEGYEIEYTADKPFLIIRHKINWKQTIEFYLDWDSNGIGWRIDLAQPTIDLNGATALYIEHEDTNNIIWNWMPEETLPGLYELQLCASKNIPIEELVLIANSVDF